MNNRQEEIRKNAKEELGIWFANWVKEEIILIYKAARKEGWRAKDALWLARIIVERDVNEYLKQNFYGRSPF